MSSKASKTSEAISIRTSVSDLLESHQPFSLARSWEAFCQSLRLIGLSIQVRLSESKTLGLSSNFIRIVVFLTCSLNFSIAISNSFIESNLILGFCLGLRVPGPSKLLQVQ